MFGSSGWWNWSITCGSGGPKRRANATNCAGVSDWPRSTSTWPRKNASLDLGERIGGERARDVDVVGLQSEARTQRFESGHRPTPKVGGGFPLA